MTTYDYMRKTVIEPLIERNEAVREKRRAEGRAEGIAIGKAEGISEGEAQMRPQFVAWLARKEDAERQGLPFDDPMPSDDAGRPTDAPPMPAESPRDMAKRPAAVIQCQLRHAASAADV